MSLIGAPLLTVELLEQFGFPEFLVPQFVGRTIEYDLALQHRGLRFNLVATVGPPILTVGSLVLADEQPSPRPVLRPRSCARICNECNSTLKEFYRWKIRAF